MTTFRGIAAAVTLAAAVWGCRGGEEPRETSDAVSATGSQPDRPRVGAGEVTLVEDLRLAAGGRWSDARDVVVDADGRFYLLDGVVPARILKFEADGRYVLRFGEDEPDAPVVTLAQEISLAPGWNTILVADRAEGAVSAFLTLGTLTYSAKVTGTPIDVVGRPQFGEYYLQGWDQARSLSGVYHMRLPIDTLGTTYEVAIPLNLPIQQTARAVYFRMTTDQAGRLYVAFHDRYLVRILEPDGTTVRLIGIDRPPVAKSSEAIASEAQENLVKLRREAAAVGDPLLVDSLLVEAARPDSVLSMIEELAIDPSGRLWVRTNRADADGVTPYDVFDEEGRYMARVDVPGDVRATAFAPDGALVVIDAAGDPAGVVVRYEVRFTRPA
jgi:hypothetical protein